MSLCASAFIGEESLMIFVDKRKLSRTSEVSESNGTAVTLEALHQLAASYFIDRESTLHKLHHIQIASTAIKVKHLLFTGIEITQNVGIFLNLVLFSFLYLHPLFDSHVLRDERFQKLFFILVVVVG